MATSNTDDFFILVLFVNVLIILLSATVLLLSLPTRVKQVLKRTQRMFDCWIGLLVVVALVALPTNVLICFVHFEWIPWPLAAHALKTATVSAGEEDMRESLAEVQDDHSAWYASHGGSRESAEEVQRMLWNSWPLVVLTCLGLTAFSIWMLGRFYTQLVLYLLKETTVKP